MFFRHDGLDYNKNFSDYHRDWTEREKNREDFGKKGYIQLFPYLRVYEIAKMFGLRSKECLEVLGDLATHHFNYVNPHMSTYLLRRHVGDQIDY